MDAAQKLNFDGRGFVCPEGYKNRRSRGKVYMIGEDSDGQLCYMGFLWWRNRCPKRKSVFF